MNQGLVGYVEILSVVVCWSIISRALIPWIQLDPFVLYPISAFIAALTCLALCFAQWRTIWGSLHYELLWPLFHICLLVGLNNLLFFAALKTTSVANAILTHYLCPLLLVTVFAPLILRERILRKHLISAVLGLLGLFVVLWDQFGADTLNIGLVWGFASAIFYAWHLTLESRLATLTTLHPAAAAVFKHGLPALILSPVALDHIVANGLNLADFGKLFLLGSFGFTFILQYRGLGKISSQEAAILFYGEPIAAIFWAYIIWSQPVSFATFVGGTLIVAAGIIAIRGRQ